MFKTEMAASLHKILYASRQIATRQLGSFIVCGLLALPHNLVYFRHVGHRVPTTRKYFSSLVSTGSVSQAQTCLHKLEHGCHVLTLEHQKILLFDHGFSAEYWTNIFNVAMILEEDGSRCVWVFFFYVGDAGNTSLVDAGTPLGATAVVTPGSAGYLLWECCILASLSCGMATSGTCSPQPKAVWGAVCPM